MKKMHIPRILALGVTGALFASSMVFTPTVAHAAGTGINDFDGDGKVDVVTGSAPLVEETIGDVNVTYGNGRVASFTAEDLGYSRRDWEGERIEDRFGIALLAANLNGDAYADLVVRDSGAIYLVYGSPGGLAAGGSQELEAADEGPIAVIPRPTPLLVAGIGRYSDAGHLNAGGLKLFPIDAQGKAGAGVMLTQNSPGVPGASESGDGFGLSIAADDTTLVVGAQWEAIGTTRAGAVTVLHRTGLTSFSGQMFHQNSPGVAGSNEKNDMFGAEVAIEDGWFAVGAPFESIGKASDTGEVHLFKYTATTAKPVRAFNQGTPGIPGSNEIRDRFGSGLAFVRPCAGQRGIAVYTSGEDNYDGRVTVVNLSTTASCKNVAVGPTDLGLKKGNNFGGILAPLRASTDTTVRDSLLVAGSYKSPSSGEGGVLEVPYPYRTIVRGRGAYNSDWPAISGAMAG